MIFQIEIYRPFATNDENYETLEFDTAKACAAEMESLTGLEAEEVEELLEQGMQASNSEDIETGRVVTAQVKGS